MWLQSFGAGAPEVMIQSIDKDGSMTGYDFPLLEALVEITTIPVIAAGGAGDLRT